MELLRKLYRNYWVLPRIHRTYRNLSLSEVFTRVYETGEWNGDSPQSFCSGSGSGGTAADEYCQRVIEFIRENQIESVADLGCGDFRVGQKITSETSVRYVGVDIVLTLVERNRAQFANERISFQCANLTSGPLPVAQLCLIRQVLQHLSNTEIQAVLRQVSVYPLALISEHVPKFPKSFNRDKPHGPDVRAYHGSGVYVDKPPFSVNANVLWENNLDEGSILRTVLVRAGTAYATPSL